MKDCEILKGLILAAFDREHENDVTLADALGLYEHMLEKCEESKTEKPEKTDKKSAKIEEKPAKIEKPEAKLSIGGGPGANEKREAFEALKNFRAERGLGCFQTIADATKGKLDADTLRDMLSGGRHSTAEWRICSQAVKKLQQEMGGHYVTRKKYIKLKMAEGLSRNEAAQNAKEIAEEGCSYQADYDFDVNADRILAELLQAPPSELQEAIGQLKEDLIEFVKEAFPIILEAAEKVCKAIADALDGDKLKQLVEMEEQNGRSDQ